MLVLVLYDSHLVIEDVARMNWTLLHLNDDHNVYMACPVHQSNCRNVHSCVSFVNYYIKV